MIRARPVATTFPVIPSPSAYVALDFLRRQPDCRLRAQPAGRFIEQHQRPAMHIQLAGNDLHHLPERIAKFQSRGENLTDLRQNGQFLVGHASCCVRNRHWRFHFDYNLSNAIGIYQLESIQ